MSSLLSSDSVNILAAANAGNNNEYTTITCCWATAINIASNNTSEEVSSMQSGRAYIKEFHGRFVGWKSEQQQASRKLEELRS
jgi:hypothetical protein